jgi:ubiquitin thioesterase protein OTUB1
MEWLKSKGWHGVRRTKGDGDCFYRCELFCAIIHAYSYVILIIAFAFAWVERILRAQDRELATAAAISTLHTTWIGLAEVGFETTIVSKLIPGDVSFIPTISLPLLSSSHFLLPMADFTPITVGRLL